MTRKRLKAARTCLGASALNGASMFCSRVAAPSACGMARSADNSTALNRRNHGVAKNVIALMRGGDERRRGGMARLNTLL